jgi:hypothetical protein
VACFFVSAGVVATLARGASWSGRTFEASPDGGGERMARRKRVEPTDEWAELKLLLEWPEQGKVYRRYYSHS